MTHKTYYEVLQREVRAAAKIPLDGRKSREQLSAEIAEITAELKRPLSDLDRIDLVAHRKYLRRELEALLEENHDHTLNR
jgi:hypothetical protein